MKRTLASAIAGAALCISAQAGLIPYTSAAAIPDNSAIGLTDSRLVAGQPSSLTGVILTVNLSGSALSDLTTAYIRLGDGASSPSVNLVDYLATSFSVNLTAVNPSFGGLNPNNTWTLFFADTSPLGANTLTGWSLDIIAVPEPLNLALPLFGAAWVGTRGLSWYLKRRRAIHPSNANKGAYALKSQPPSSEPAHPRSARNADFQSAVSPICNRQAPGRSWIQGSLRRSNGQQVEDLRYGQIENLRYGVSARMRRKPLAGANAW